MIELIRYCRNTLRPYMTRKTPNRKHSVYVLKHIVEAEIGQYVSEEELQMVLFGLGFPISDYYPIQEEYFKLKGGLYHG